jgi:hypothetical protein
MTQARFPNAHPEYMHFDDNDGVFHYYNEDSSFNLDVKDHLEILNSGKKFVLNDDMEYPYYVSNGKKFTLLEYIYKFDYMTSDYKFINSDNSDLRRSNVKIYHHYNDEIKKVYQDCEYIQGHYNSLGVDAYIMKNPLWKVKENGKEILLMYCEKNTICKLCEQSYQKIVEYENKNNDGAKMTWYRCDNGYIAGKAKHKQVYIHQVIMNYYGNGQGTGGYSVDHIDRDQLNNTMDNLRIATREEQEQNSKGIAPGTKRNRQYSARDLPEGITQDMLKKYVVYYYNVYDKKNNKAREYFSVEGHPKLEKRWESSKSCEVSILEKLNQANKVIADLENDIYPVSFTEQRGLPKSVSVIHMRDKPHLSFDKRLDNGERMNLKMIMPDNYVLDEELNKFLNKIRVKYNIPEFNF